jgi:hypothetical protein
MGDHELLDIEEWGLVLNKVCFSMLRSINEDRKAYKTYLLCISLIREQCHKIFKTSCFFMTHPPPGRR